MLKCTNYYSFPFTAEMMIMALQVTRQLVAQMHLPTSFLLLRSVQTCAMLASRNLTMSSAMCVCACVSAMCFFAGGCVHGWVV